MSSSVDRPWVVPDDDTWDSADGGASRSSRMKAKGASPRTSTRNAEAWLTNPAVSTTPDALNLSEDRSDGAVMSSPDRSDGAVMSSPDPAIPLNHKATPQTLASTPPETTKDTIPPAYTKLISSAFGPNADLYEDVLRVSRDATQRAIRIAYFRRGREVLSMDQGVPNVSSAPPATSASLNGEVSHVSKKRFQAVSMAYDILSNPSWRYSYDTSGLHGQYHWSDDELGMSTNRSVGSTSALRKSSSGKERRSSSNNGVRWNEEVEELLFDQDEDEVSFKAGFSEPETDADGFVVPSKKKKKKKKKVVVEAEELQDHLASLDAEAQGHFVTDFLDDLEKSIEDILSFGTSYQEPKEYFKDARKKLFKEECVEEVENDRPDVSSGKKKKKDKKSKKTNRPIADEERESIPRQVAVPSSINKESVEDPLFTADFPDLLATPDEPIPPPKLNNTQADYFTPDDILVEKKHSRGTNEDGASTVYTVADSVSTMSASVVDKEPRSRSVSLPGAQLETLDEEANEMVNTTEDAVVNVNGHTSEKEAWTKETVSDECGLLAHDLGCDKWFGNEPAPSPIASPDREGPVVERATGPSDDMDAEEPPSFYVFLMSYLKALSTDVQKWGQSIREMDCSVTEAIMLSEDDLEGMVSILRTELSIAPGDMSTEAKEQKEAKEEDFDGSLDDANSHSWKDEADDGLVDESNDVDEAKEEDFDDSVDDANSHGWEDEADDSLVDESNDVDEVKEEFDGLEDERNSWENDPYMGDS